MAVRSSNDSESVKQGMVFTYDDPLVEVASGSYLCCMRAVGLKALKNKLSEYIRMVAAGETVLVTDREVVVAELIPPREGRARRVDDVELAELVRTGVVEPPTTVAPEPPPRIPVAPTAEILDDLARDRDER